METLKLNDMREWFTRFPQKDINQIYLNNMIEATELFMNWFNTGTDSYIDMLAEMHKIVSNGYSGHTSTRGPLITRNGFRGDILLLYYLTNAIVQLEYL
jgi:hypothetical protein